MELGAEITHSECPLKDYEVRLRSNRASWNKYSAAGFFKDCKKVIHFFLFHLYE